MNEILNQYQQEGLSFFPVPYKSKAAVIEWKQFMTRKPTESEITRWQTNNTNIAIVCGSISGNLVVIDFDSHTKFTEYCKLFTDAGLDLFTYTRVVRTNKGCHVYYRLPYMVKSMKYPQVDIKAEGGYVLAPPSVHPTGTKYEICNPNVPITTIKDLKDVFIDTSVKSTETSQHPNWVSDLLKGTSEGSRDDTAIKLIGYFRNSQPKEVTLTLMLDWNSKCAPPLDERVIVEKVERAYQKLEEHAPPAVDKPLSERIDEWVRMTSGWFDYNEIDREFGLSTTTEKHNRSEILRRMREKGTIEAHHTRNTMYRFVNTTMRLIDFKNFVRKEPIDIKYPFGIENIFETYPGNIIAIAGSPDAGKTAFLLNVVHKNMFKLPIYYQSSEMGKEELANRLSNFPDLEVPEWHFTAEERSGNFADVIRPDCVNIIDYLEFGEGEFWMIAEYLRAIHDKLRSGICIVAVQKKRGQALGRGAEFGLEKPRLYLSMDAGKITIQKAKNWADHNFNPNGKVLSFKLVRGCEFITTDDWHEEEYK